MYTQVNNKAYFTRMTSMGNNKVAGSAVKREYGCLGRISKIKQMKPDSFGHTKHFMSHLFWNSKSALLIFSIFTSDQRIS
jgi:hypothetical protein